MRENLAIGCDIGSTNTKIVLLRADGQIVRRATTPTTSHGDPLPYFSALRDIMTSFSRAAVRGVGVSTTGLVAPDRRSIRFNPNTPALVGVDYVDQLAALGWPVLVDADLNAAALGELAFGAGRGAARLLVATIGTGLGAGIIADNRVVRFAAHMAGDTGHVILDPTGPRCTAGCRGCAEAFVSSPGLVRAYSRAGTVPEFEGAVTARAIVSAARQARPLALAAVGEVGSWAGHWLASLAPIFLPDRIVLCGGIAEAGEALFASCRARFAELVGPEYACPIVGGELGALAGAVGAAVPFLAPTIG